MVSIVVGDELVVEVVGAIAIAVVVDAFVNIEVFVVILLLR